MGIASVCSGPGPGDMTCGMQIAIAQSTSRDDKELVGRRIYDDI